MDEIENNAFSMIADFDGDIIQMFNQENIPTEDLPLLPVKNMVLLPGVIAPILLARPMSIEAVKRVSHNQGYLTIFCQKDPQTEWPTTKDLHPTGVYARVVKMIDMPNGNITVIVQGESRCQLLSARKKRTYISCSVMRDNEEMCPENDIEFQSGLKTLREMTATYIQQSDQLPNEAVYAVQSISNHIMALNFICTNMPFSTKEKLRLLQCSSLKERLFEVMKLMSRELQLQQLNINIKQKTHEQIDEQQRNYFLEKQIENIRHELGGEEGSPEVNELKARARQKKWNDATQANFDKELKRLEQLHFQSPDWNVQYSYLQMILDLPWETYTDDNLSLSHAEKTLDKNHYGLEKVKERILEYLAVMAMKGGKRATILCLYGPPGVGKTSLCRSIADAMGRKYVRMSLGGMHDESEIRGHRKTYIGAMPGRIIKNMKKAGSSNPVFVLDEIDKVTGQTVNGDPSSALLEVLDPEQNHAFHDNYLDMDYDLSHVLFIATANDLGGIPRPLLDRMELIEVSGYTTEEKIEIGKRHLAKKAKADAGFTEPEWTSVFKFNKASLEKVIEQYTRESGVRQLEKQISKIMRKCAYKHIHDQHEGYKSFTPQIIEELLGKPPFYRDIYQGNDYAGVVTGLAWTSVGGEILFIETSLSKGKGSRLTITGNLGDVMKESATIALEFVKAHADVLNIDYRIFDNWNIHIHVPEGATPKDGPSAGITIATSIASALTQRKVRKNTAMTGEITLRGKVLPVGGIKEKILAAKRAGITDILLCQENRKDIEDIPAHYLTGVRFHYVENVLDVWKFALTDEMVATPVEFTITEEKKEPCH